MWLLAALFDWFSFDRVQVWIAAVGYPALFGLLFACGLGLPLPEDIPLVISGALIAKGSMTWLWAGICAWCGIIGGDCVLYFIARKYGMGVTRLPVIGKHVTVARIQQVEGLFVKYGVGVVAVGRLFAGIRGAMVVCAGVTRFNFAKFVIADGLAALISGGLFMWLGYWLGNKLTPETFHEYKHWFTIGAIVLAVLLVIWILWKRRHRQEVIDREVAAVEKIVAAEKKVAEKLKHPHGDPEIVAPTPTEHRDTTKEAS